MKQGRWAAIPPPGSSAKQGVGTLAMVLLVSAISAFAWIGAPRMALASRSANESAAVADLRRIAAAQAEWTLPLELHELIAETPDLADWMIDGSGIARRRGYRVQMFVEGERWTACAWPETAGATGTYAFAIDERGRLWSMDNRSNPETTE